MKTFASSDRRLWLLLAVVVFLSACTTPTYYPPRDGNRYPPVIEQGTEAPIGEPLPPPPTTTRPPVPMPSPAPVDRPQSPAVVALLDTAEAQANSGDLEAAAASLERAIRIDPRNPALWYHLATVRLSQGEARAAEQLAVKSNSLSTGNNAQQARNWELIARARRAQNDMDGAKAAERKARSLR